VCCVCARVCVKVREGGRGKGARERERGREGERERGREGERK